MISEEIVHINGIPKKAVVFLHGYQDTAEHIDHKTVGLQSLNDVALHIPQAPFVNEVDSEKRQWYSIHQFDPDDKRRSAASFDEFVDFYNRMTLGLEESNYLILQYVDNLLQEYGLGYEDLFLCGFSQGAMCALYSGVMCPYRMGGIISFSGILAARGFVEQHARSNPDILLIHGLQDDKIRFAASSFSADILQKLGCSVETCAFDDGGHKITPTGIEAAKQFICARMVSEENLIGQYTAVVK